MSTTNILAGIAVRSTGIPTNQPSAFAKTYEGPRTAAFHAMSRDLFEQYPFLPARSNIDFMSESELRQFDALFAWLADQLRTFPLGAGDPAQTLLKILALATLLDCDGELWGELEKAAPNPPAALVAPLIQMVNEERVDGPSVLVRPGFSARHVHSALKDVEEKNWHAVEWVVDHLEADLYSAIRQQAVAALFQFDRSCLQLIIENEQDFFVIAAYVLEMPSIRCLSFAVPSANWTFKFWAMQHSARLAAAGGKCYPIEWEALLSEAASVPSEWSRWLDVLNRYPARYPQIQTAMGGALSIASGPARDVYLSSLMESDYSRDQIAKALSRFCELAEAPVRDQLWRAAFKKWSQWDFGRTEYSKHILSVAKSGLDFMIVGYFVESMDAEGRADYLGQLRIRALGMERDWHATLSPAISERFRLLSAFQPLAHAETVLTGDLNWLWEAPYYKPDWEDGTLYRSLMYNANVVAVRFRESKE